MNDIVQNQIQDQFNFAVPTSSRFAYFDIMFSRPDWSRSTVLDVQGTHNEILKESTGRIDHNNFFCVDFNKERLEKNKQVYPDANWLEFNTFHYTDNPTGILYDKFPLSDHSVDLITCYSIYSHATVEHLLHDLAEFKRILKPSGQVCFTVVDINSVEHFIRSRRSKTDKKCLSHKELLVRRVTEYAYFVDNDLIVDRMFNTSKVENFVTVYNIEWLSKKITDMGFDLKVKFPPQGHAQMAFVITC